MANWIYKTIHSKTSNIDLNLYGSEEWELVSAMQLKEESFMFIFKKVDLGLL